MHILTTSVLQSSHLKAERPVGRIEDYSLVTDFSDESERLAFELAIGLEFMKTVKVAHYLGHNPVYRAVRRV